MKYRKKAIVIEAEQWDGTLAGLRRIETSFPGLRTSSLMCHKERGTVQNWRINTLEGSYRVAPKDFVIRGIKGEHYPCKPDIFEATYEVEEATDGE
jgi:hypothetical protein